jgi:hypothetical protein
MSSQNLLGFCLDYPDTTATPPNGSRTNALPTQRRFGPARLKKEYPMTQFATAASFSLESLFVASARRAGRAAPLGLDGSDRGFAKHLEAARALHQPMTIPLRDVDRSEEDPERWDGLS